MSLVITTALVTTALGGCSDPSPPPARAAMATSIYQGPQQNCPMERPVLSIADGLGPLKTNGGTERVTQGKGASVSCTVKANGTGFTLKGNLSANALEQNAAGVHYNVKFSFDGDYAQTTLGGAAIVDVTIDDTLTQHSYIDPTCSITVRSLGENNAGGALWADLNCTGLTDPSTAGSSCSMDGTMVFENCDK